MTRRRLLFFAAGGLALVAVIWIRQAIRPAGDGKSIAKAVGQGVSLPHSDSPGPVNGGDRGKAVSPSSPERPAMIPTGRSEVADGLNAPDGSIEQDLKIVNEIFVAWISNFRGEGNPVGDNREVTAALCGENRLGIELIPRDHRALNARGELCDRWGTPFRFHMLSRMQMEIRAAGPDKKFGTSDDAEWAPWPRNF